MSDMAAVVSWFGPHLNLAAAKKDAQTYYTSGLYVVFGYCSIPAIGPPKLLYVGVGAPLYTRLVPTHHKISTIDKITSVWLGEISSHLRPGRREKKIEPMIDAVEWAMIALLRPELNDRKRNFPLQSFAITNRWWSKDDYAAPVQKPAMIWPDVIECAGSDAPAYMCWLEQRKVRRFERPIR